MSAAGRQAKSVASGQAAAKAEVSVNVDPATRVAVAVTQSTAAITEVSHSTQGAHELSGAIAGQVGDGQERMRAMAEVVRGTAETAKRAEKMAESISQIADQTHMVALNARTGQILWDTPASDKPHVSTSGTIVVKN